MTTHTTELYFECHITIEPVFDERLELLKEIVKPYGFHIADLLMCKRPTDTPVRSKFDTFCTGRDVNYRKLRWRMHGLIDDLEDNEFRIWRYKIENTLLDVQLRNDRVATSP